MIFFISDTHFFHDRIIEFSKRPFINSKEMNEKIIENWNNIVGQYDDVYHIGDVALGNTPDDLLTSLVKELNGQIKLIPGNHDTLRRIAIYEQAGWEILPPLVHLKKLHTTLCHFPMQSWYHSHHGEFQLHGHVHGALEEQNMGLRRKDVGVDCNNFTPIPFEVIKEELLRRPYFNHHGAT